jgi:hypothetical protein
MSPGEPQNDHSESTDSVRGESRRDWREILWELRVLWGVVALLIVLDLVSRPLVFTGEPTSLAPLQGYASQPERANVLVLGSSRFRKVLPDRVAAGSGDGVSVRVLAFNGGGLVSQRSAVERYLPPEVLVDTDLLLIGVSPGEVDDGYYNPVLAAKIWDWGDFSSEVVANGFNELTTGFLFEHFPLGYSALAQGKTARLARVELRGIGMRMMASLGLMKSAYDGKKKLAHQSEPGSATEVMGSDARRAGSEVTGLDQIEPPAGMLRGYRVGGRQLAALRRLVAYLDANGVAAALVHAPDSEWYRRGYWQGVEDSYVRALGALGEELDLAIFVLDAGGYGLSDRDFFRLDGTYDGYHLATDEGLDRFSTSLGREVVAPMMRERRAGRRPGYDLSRFELE